MNRVVITGLGVVSSIGLNKEEMWTSLVAGKSGATPITGFDTKDHDVHIAAEIKNFDPEKWGIDRRSARRLDRFSQFALACSKDALADTRLDLEKCDRHRIGVIIGSGIGGFNEYEEQHTRLLQKGPSKVSAFIIPKLMINAAAGQVAIHFKLKGPNFSTASACASANHALAIALRMIRYGDADIILAGGSEASITPLAIAGFSATKALSLRNDEPTKASRPFDKNRDGFVMGEGCGIMVFEKLDHALARGARIYAEVLGAGMNDDGYHITAPDPEGTGAAESMNLAMKDANLKPTDVTYINAHGTSTPLNDLIETKAMKKVFGPHAKKLVISSTKSMIGHLLGASGGVELIAAIMSIKNNKVHPTINYETPDPECDLDYVPNQARELEVNVAMSNSFGFGGHNATIVVGKYKK